MRTLDETDRLLDLLREAGDEPVTLDELEVVGVRDPAAALLSLELAGHGVTRVTESPGRGRTVTCVRLARPDEPPTPLPSPPRPSPDRRPVALLAVAALVVLLVVARR